MGSNAFLIKGLFGVVSTWLYERQRTAMHVPIQQLPEARLSSGVSLPWGHQIETLLWISPLVKGPCLFSPITNRLFTSKTTQIKRITIYSLLFYAFGRALYPLFWFPSPILTQYCYCDLEWTVLGLEKIPQLSPSGCNLDPRYAIVISSNFLPFLSD